MLLVFPGALWAEPMVIDLRFVQDIAFWGLLQCVFFRNGNVDNTVAGCTEKVGMTATVGIVLCSAFVNGNHSCRSLFHQQAECVVDRGL